MAKREPVNLAVQVILTVIPLGWIFTFYRIEKLKLGFLIMILFIIGASMVNIYFLIEEEGSMFGEEAESSKYGIIVQVMGISITIVFVYLIIRWSREWNKNLSLSEDDYKHPN